MVPWREEESVVMNGETVIICTLSGLFPCKNKNKKAKLLTKIGNEKNYSGPSSD